MGLVEQLPRAVRLSRHRSLAENRNGRDFYVGDLDGTHGLLEDELAARSFSPERDRVIAVGDLVDRGSESFDTLALVHEPWFYSTLGNHELSWWSATRRARTADTWPTCSVSIPVRACRAGISRCWRQANCWRRYGSRAQNCQRRPTSYSVRSRSS